MNIRPTGLRKFWVALAGVLLLTWCVYRPGLSGGFLFDDFINLNALGSSGPIDNWASFWRYLTSGTADPTGRPIALLSFLIDARDWPADPRPFLRTNLIIHMINGALLYALLRFLGRALGDESETKLTAAPLLAAALWLMHPLFVSTTLYAVQREAMLPATFVLLGLITYSRGRVSFATTEAQRGLMLMWVGICLGTMLALLCKANGMLLPLLAWVLEATVFCGLPKLRAGSEAARSLFRAKLWLLWVPSGAVLVYLSHFLADWTSTPAGRAWTIGQRVLTEPRILLDYLQLLLVPRSVSSGLFNDNYQASHGLFQPATTVLSLLMVIACLLLALRYRAKFPALAGAVLFFFAGQALESSSVPLELYFEHRNYLPALLLFWPLARAVCAWNVGPMIRGVAGLSLVAIVATTTVQRTQMWGHPDQLAMLWATLNAESSRAQAAAAMHLVEGGRTHQALSMLGVQWRERPYDLQIATSYFTAACATGRGLSATDKRRLSRTIRTTIANQALLYRWLTRATEIAAAGKCGDLDLDDVRAWVMDTGSHSSTLGMAGNNRDALLGRIELFQEHPDLALVHFNQQLLTIPKPETAAVQAALLASRGYFDHALAHLDHYEHHKAMMLPPAMGMPFVHAKVLQMQDYWPREMHWLRTNFENARRSQTGTP